MALKTMIENLNKARADYEAQLASIGENAQKAVAEFLSPLVPPGYAVTWRQYTPHFNDGDACTFSVHDPELAKLDDDGDTSEGIDFGTAIERYGKPDEIKSYMRNDYSYGRGNNEQVKVEYTEHGFPAIDGWSVEKLEALGKAWGELPEDMLESAFGDHVSVAIKYDGTFDVSDYSHD